ncbi:DUF4190 domain-containing protein [Kocuria salsicia]|uniref:DUF4190 domain-containing protein n=1 Tax=Kocuria salsicia TaxID=664639 RepID=UPI0011A039BE|nr:DUF4190 domain-containing protein [Kocuria salsicia]MBS6030521.1 DUF4190 domain-containing protein [Kocuria rhizophila]
MTTSNQPAAGGQPSADRPQARAQDEASRGQRYSGGTGRGHDTDGQNAPARNNDAHGRGAMTAPTNSYQPYAQPTGRWEYVPGSPEDAQRQQQVLKSTDASLVLGILGVTVLPILAPFAVWQASKAEKLGGRATAGKILGWVGVAVLILTLVWLAFILAIWGFAMSEIQGQFNSSNV